MRHFISVVQGFLLVGLFASNIANAATFNVMDYGAKGDGVTNDAAAILNTIKAAENAGSNNDVYLPAVSSCYMLGDDSTNAGDTEVEVTYARGLRILGDTGGTTICNPTSDRQFFYVWNDQSLTLQNLILKRTAKLFTQMTVDAIDTSASTVTVTIQSSYKAPNDSTIFDPAGGITPLLLVFSDPNSGTWGDHLADTAIYSGSNPPAGSPSWPPNVTAVTQQGTQWVLSLNSAPLASWVGKVAVEWPATSGGGAPAFTGQVSSDVTFQDVTYYAEGAENGMTIVDSSGNWLFNDYKIIPGPGEYISAKGGTFVYDNENINLTIQKSEIVGTWDDNFNMGAHSRQIESQVSPTVITTSNSGEWNVGDTVAIWDWAYKAEHERGRAKITAVSCSSNCTLTFDRSVTVGTTGSSSGSLPEDQDGIDRVIDINNAGSLAVTGSTFQSMHARNIVLRVDNANITGNTFMNTEGPAVYAGFDWGVDEGPGGSNETISSNTFQHDSGANILIGSEGNGLTYSSVPNLFTNYTISNNTFPNLDPYQYGTAGPMFVPIFMSSATGTVENNSYAPYDPNQSLPAQGVEQLNSTVTAQGNTITSNQ